MTGGTVRRARPGDEDAVLGLVRELAAYERMPAHVVRASAGDYATALFPPDGGAAHVGCHVAEVDGAVVGFALWYSTFSTWTGQPGIWLDDLFVRPEHRGSGLGRALLAALAALCLERGGVRLEWWVLDWNQPAIGFYRRLGAVGMDEWTVQRLEGPALAALATQPGTGRGPVPGPPPFG